jgi:outer membrane lipoprotein-sorting protein
MSTMGEYKKFGGVLMPTKLENQMGPQKMVVTIKDVTLNAVPESAFAIPENVKPLIKK